MCCKPGEVPFHLWIMFPWEPKWERKISKADVHYTVLLLAGCPAEVYVVSGERQGNLSFPFQELDLCKRSSCRDKWGPWHSSLWIVQKAPQNRFWVVWMLALLLHVPPPPQISFVIFAVFWISVPLVLALATFQKGRVEAVACDRDCHLPGSCQTSCGSLLE